MAILDILLYPDERLRTVAQPVEKVDDEIRQLVGDMIKTMYDAKGIGLAATQVDVHQQVIVMDLSENHDDILVLINPTIIEKDGQQVFDEGCLSVPDYSAEVERAATITVAALNEQGQAFELQAQGLQAVCIQHEMDHLKGIVFVDYLSRLKQDRIHKKALKAQREAVAVT